MDYVFALTCDTHNQEDHVYNMLRDQLEITNSLRSGDCEEKHTMCYDA